jgi:hypothetical protein
MSTIEERLSGPGATPWIPDEENAKKWLAGGEERTVYSVNPVIGMAVDHYTRDTAYGIYDVLVLNVEGFGDVAVHCRGTVLQNEMTAARPKYGERVGVKLTGEGEGARGKYPVYKVVVERERGGDFAWSNKLPVVTAQEEFPSRQVNETAPTASSALPESSDDDIPF